MSPTIPNSPRSAGQSCRQIELVPSRRAAALAAAWLVAMSAALLGGVALPLPARITLCVCMLVSGTTGIRSGFLFRDRRALRAISWNADGPLVVHRVCDGIALPAELAHGSFRIGQLGLFLWLSTREGRHGLFIDAGLHDSHELRRLCRRLSRRPRRALTSGRPTS